MTPLPSELLGLIADFRYAVRRLHQNKDQHGIDEEYAAFAALIAGIERYREEGQEAAAQVADEFVVRNDERSKDLRLSQRDRDLCEARSSAAYRVARSIRALRPTPPEEPKP